MSRAKRSCPKAAPLLTAASSCPDLRSATTIFSDGRRQITAIHVPGDFADLHSLLLRKMDGGVTALTSCRVASVAHKDLREVTRSFPFLTRALWLTTLIDGAVHRIWMTSLGRMDAREPLAHFLCELPDRLASIGMVKDDSFELPLTQADLSDAFGLSTVHVNRTLLELRSSGLISSSGKTLTIRDRQALQRIAQYNPDYLRIDQKLERD
ncbi:Crp/Fnr family transcriptional regulator [Microvirga makkahensis]|uniref:Helix-turn-helix domain-containing protein n=1 Tax=Microvirga makkahensis TaxID=1128670 RepID=A0A7X3MRH7_9HYPH|nr:Crp/Fnr family transcriptional regulator [Microvirga makkahensis]MXQ11903.1 helix-turn-helix domain-containing protein [Microvirga makkahensis]